MSVIGEFARNPIFWTRQFFGLAVEEVKAQQPAKAVAFKAIDAVEALPFDAGLVLTQSVSDPGTFTGMFVDAYPDVAVDMFGEAGVLGPFEKLFSYIKWLVVGVVAVAVIALVVSFFPALRAASGGVGKVVDFA